jgi:Zn-dependent metalloprotease
MTSRTPRPCSFLPPYLLAHLVEAGESTDDRMVADCCRGTLEVDAEIRSRREARASGSLVDAPAPAPAPEAGGAAWTVHDAGGTTTLPGTPVRSAGEPETGDAAVDEASHGVEGSLALFAEVYGRDSYDDAGAPVLATVHYGRNYVNAFWDGSQLVFGDGDGTIFGRFTKAVDVLGHEFAHAVTEHTAGLVYQGQSGALNESVSDVFAACLTQRLADQTVDRADWLIGADLFLEGVRARGGGGRGPPPGGAGPGGGGAAAGGDS